MSAHLRWLTTQLEEWAALGLLSREQARAIRARYPEIKGGAPWGMIIFTGIGAVIVGLGIILLFAYNWAAMTKAAKLAVVVGALIAAHAAGIALFRRDGWQRGLGDTFCLLGTMLFGAGIWLVAQIYHIDEHYPTAFLIWSFGALALAWVMPSVMQGMLAAALIAIWVCCETFDFNVAYTWAPLLIAAALGVLAWRLRARVLLFFTLGALLVACGAITHTLDGHVLLLLLTLAAAFIAAGVLAGDGLWFAASAPIWGLIGWSVFLVCCYLCSFKGFQQGLLRWPAQGSTFAYVLYTWAPFALALGLWCGVAWARTARMRPRAPDEHGMELILVPVAVVACQYIMLRSPCDIEVAAAGVFNLVLLALALAWMARGCRQALLARTVMGSAIMAAVVAGRYFDLFESLAARGLVFVIIGGVLFAEGILFMRARRRMRHTEGRP
jgi:uncharacterized membrane protein